MFNVAALECDGLLLKEIEALHVMVWLRGMEVKAAERLYRDIGAEESHGSLRGFVDRRPIELSIKSPPGASIWMEEASPFSEEDWDVL